MGTFRFIAGFASSAAGIMNRPPDQLRRALPFLDKSFFEAFPDYKFVQQRITETDTPQLYLRIKTPETLRTEQAHWRRPGRPVRRT
jgi:hypothetical protein